jgi:hypothetical protein
MTDKPSFYDAVKHIKHDNHESDLYLLWTSESAELVKQYGKNAQTFVSQVDKQLYFDIPFAYEPWWIAKTGRP